jgi:glycosidase
MRPFRFRSLRACFLAIGAYFLGTAACVTIPDTGKQPALGTHVDDWRDEVVYQLMVDRFADGDINNNESVQTGSLARYQGGDWQGIIDHLDYLEALGVTTLWISPVIKNVDTDADVDAYHGYWAQDITKTNPHFGDLAMLRTMVSAVHARGMKVVLDIVLNHMGQLFFYDMNLNGKPDIYIAGTGCDPNSPATPFAKNPDGSCKSGVTRITEFDPDWDPDGVQAYTSLGPAGRAPLLFVHDPTISREPPPGILGTFAAYHGFGRILDYNDPAQRMNGDFPGGLKDINTENPDVRAELIDKYARWVELADLDGFRIDTLKHVPHDFWVEFTGKVRSRLAAQGKNKFIQFGEDFDFDDGLLGSYTQKGELDSVFYFTQKGAMGAVFEQAHDPMAQQGTDAIANTWKQQGEYGQMPQDQGIGVAPAKALVNFLDNHDFPRFLFHAEKDTDALRNALTVIFTEQGIPCLYYGTEQDFSGGDDPSNREVLWNTGFPTTGDTFRHIAKLARLRKAYEALRRGDTTVRWSSGHHGMEEDAGILAFERTGGEAADKYALVVVNSNARKASSTSNGTTLMQVARAGATLVDVLDPMRTQYSVDGSGNLKVTVPAQSAMLLVPADQVLPE